MAAHALHVYMYIGILLIAMALIAIPLKITAPQTPKLSSMRSVRDGGSLLGKELKEKAAGFWRESFQLT